MVKIWFAIIQIQRTTWHLAFFSGCEPLDAKVMWGLPLAGRKLPLGKLIRFPTDYVRYDRTSTFVSDQPCGPEGKLVYDFEAFELDENGQLIFTRALGSQKVASKAFCLDLVSGSFMAALFCQPNNVTEISLRTQTLLLPNSAQKIQIHSITLYLVSHLLCFLSFVSAAVNKIWIWWS